METTINKVAVLKLKESIKNAAERQKWFKNQRKTVNKDHSKKLGGMEDISPSEATWKHSTNRGVLRVMYAAYALMRKRKIENIDSLDFGEEWAKDVFLQSVDRMVEMYEKEAEKETKKEVA